LVKICFNNIPNDFGVSVYDQMQSPKFDSLEEFLSEFFKFIRANYYQPFLKSKPLNMAFPTFSSSSSSSSSSSTGVSGKDVDKRSSMRVLTLVEEDDKDEKAERQEIPKKTGKTEVKGLENDLALPAPFSDEELKVLQSLSQRRDLMDKRERDLEQREKLLQAAEKKVDEKVTELNSLKKKIEELLQGQQDMQDERVAQLVKIYESMKPKDAANIFNDMKFNILLGIIDKMSERKVAPILAAMTPERAREVSARLAEQKSLPKKAE
jgi:flagellar motility protein MotE (MotC chaperone)